MSMTMDEAGRMEESLQRIIRRRFSEKPPVIAYQNDIGQWVVVVGWRTGSVYLTSVRECIRAARHFDAAGGGD